MHKTADIQIILNDKTQSIELQDIAHKVHRGERITEGDALVLFEKADLSFVGALANFVREKKHGDATFFNRNFHIEPTNLCIYTCNFCSYSAISINFSGVSKSLSALGFFWNLKCSCCLF